jgi:pseudouridine-5'-monophosphatase
MTAKMAPPRVRACLFDMDGILFYVQLTTGLLIDSERIYTEVTNTILAEHGKGPLTAEVKAKIMGT